MAIPDLLPILFLVDVGHAPRHYRYRLIGTELAAFSGRDMTGSMVDRPLYGPYGAAICRRFDQVVDAMVPHVAFTAARWVERKAWVDVAVLLLPLSPDETTVNMLMRGVVMLPSRPTRAAAIASPDPLAAGKLVRLVE